MRLGALDIGFGLAATLACCYAVPARGRWAVLLAASVAFVAIEDLPHLPVLALLIASTFVAGRALERAEGARARRALLLAGLAPLAIGLVAFRAAATFSIALPLGLSFYTLRLAGYLADLFRGAAPAERHAGRFALFGAFFPELPAGPIERGKALLPQLAAPPDLRYESIASGAKLFAWGLFKKIVVADRLRAFVGAVYDNPAGGWDGAAYAAATLYFAIQIYCDFSGYSDMAIGAGEMFGLRLAKNFDRPYQAKTIAEFWTRWHVSFSTWLRDYVFLPLVYRAGRLVDRACSPAPRVLARRQEEAAYAFAALTTMGLCGVWHGTAWHYVAWGLVMGAFMVVSVITRKARGRAARRIYAGSLRPLRDPARTAMTFALVCVSWVFFRAGSVGGALEMLAAMPGGMAGWLRGAGRAAAAFISGGPAAARLEALAAPIRLGQHPFDLAVALAGIALLLAVEQLQRRRGSVRGLLGERPAFLRWPVYAALVLAILALRVPAASGFIYAGF